MSLFATDRERTILRLFKNNTPQAMSILYDEYAGWLTAVCSRYVVNEEDRKDVLQESFIKIFTRINAFEYRGKGSLKAWMSRIAVNESLMMLRRSATNPADTTDNLPDIPDEEPDTDNLSAEEIAEMIKKLPQGYRVVFNLYAVEGRSHKEIAETLGIKPDTSASQFHKAKNLLAKMINDYKKQKELQSLQKQTKEQRTAALTVQEIRSMGKKTITGNITLTPSECSTLKDYAVNGILAKAENSRLEEKLQQAKKSATVWKQRYESLKEQARPYLEAVKLAPEKVRAFLDAILTRPRQTRQHDQPSRRKSQDIEL